MAANIVYVSKKSSFHVEKSKKKKINPVLAQTLHIVNTKFWYTLEKKIYWTPEQQTINKPTRDNSSSGLLRNCQKSGRNKQKKKIQEIHNKPQLEEHFDSKYKGNTTRYKPSVNMKAT